MSKLWDALNQVPLFAGLRHEPENCLDFLKGGTELRLQAGEHVVHEGDPAAFYVLLEGDLHVHKKVGEHEMLLTTHHPGTFFGEIPLLLGTTFVAGGQATGPAWVFRLREEAFWQMLSACPSVTRTVLQTMAQRVQNLESISQGREKLASLGTMAAGLAHELNNPAAASQRAVGHLRETFHALPSQTCRLNKQRLAPAQLEFLAQFERDAAGSTQPSIPLDPLECSDREEEMSQWMESRGVENSWKLAPALVRAGLDINKLNELATQIPPIALGEVLSWLEANLTAESLLGEIEQSVGRIAELVKAVKAYSYVDQAPLQEIDVHEGLENTLTMLGHKLKNVKVAREYDRALPRICAYGSELNQVWTNLIDNAVDAVAARGDGQIAVSTARENGHVVVEIADNGAGIPAEIQGRIFEPFFTTKGVGAGTGLGLVISHRIVVGHHHGDIRVESQPGATRFQVRLPVEPQ